MGFLLKEEFKNHRF